MHAAVEVCDTENKKIEFKSVTVKEQKIWQLIISIVFFQQFTAIKVYSFVDTNKKKKTVYFFEIWCREKWTIIPKIGIINYLPMIFPFKIIIKKFCWSMKQRQ